MSGAQSLLTKIGNRNSGGASPSINVSQSVDISATLKVNSKVKHGISATKRSELFPQAMTKQEKKEIIMKQLAENQY